MSSCCSCRCVLRMALLLAAGLIGVNATVRAAVVSWSGGGSDQNWSTGGAGGNWSGDAAPGAADDAVFTDAGGAAGVLTNVVDGSVTVQSLSYQLDSAVPAAFFHTTEIAAGQTLLVTGDLGVAPSNIAGFTGQHPVDVTIRGATSSLQVGNSGTHTANVVLGHAPVNSTGAHSVGLLDLSGVGSFTANVNLLSLASGLSSWQSTGYAELVLAPTNEINAKSIEMGRVLGYSNLLLGQDNTIQTNTMYVNMGKGATSGAYTNEVRFQAGLTNPVLNLSGLDNDGVDLFIGTNITAGTGGASVGTMDLSGGVFNATLDDLTVGRFDYSNAGGSVGTLVMDAGSVTANNVILAQTNAPAGSESKTKGTITMRGGSFDVSDNVTDGAGVSTIEILNGTMTVGGDFAVDNVLVGSNGGTAVLDIDGAVVIGSGADSALNVAVVTGSGTDGGAGTLDLAGATSVAINVGTVRIANSGNGVSSTGTVHLSGGANTIRADEIVIGNRKSSATVDMAAGGSLDIQGQIGARANLSIGVNDINTGSTPLATLDATAGAFTAQLDQLVLGYKSGSSLTGTGNGELLLGTNAANNVSAKDVVIAYQSGTGSATGLLQMRGGTFAVSGSVSDGGGTSTIQLDGGAMTVANGLQVDNLRVAFDGLSANLTVNGGDVVIGTGTETFNIGSRSAVTSGSTLGTVDFSGAASVSIDVAQLGLAQIPTASGTTAGTLILPTTGAATINATVISLGDIPSSSGSGLASLQLGGGTTDIAVDHFYVSRRKKSGEVTIEAGGELNLVGRSVAEANLYIGYNDVHTAGETTGAMDLAGSTFNAELDNLIVGYHYRPSVSNETVRGSGTGVLTFDAGAVSANSVVVGSGHASHDGRGYGTINMNGGFWTADAITLGAGNANTRGTFNLAGGTLDAGSIGQGVSGSTVAFNFTGGTLHVDQFGSSSLPLNLLQQGGTLAPGHSVGTTAIFGDYTQEELGTLEIEIAGLGDHDLVTVDGNALLDGALDVVLLDGYTAELGDYFDVLTTTGDLTLGTLAVAGDPPNPTFGWWEAAVVDGAGGLALRLSAAPEPGTMLLVLLGLVFLLGHRRR